VKVLVFMLLILLSSCSTTEKKADTPPVFTNDSFKKERPLGKREVQDFYSANIKTMTPALQDETLDRHTRAEVSEVQDPSDPLLSMAVMCSKGEFEEAFGVASRAFNKYQKLPGYWNQVANCHLNQGNHRKALLFYNKSLEVSSNYVPALNNIGVLYSRQGQNQKALVAFERANKNSKFSKTPRYNLGKLYLTYGLAEEALPIFQSLLKDSPQDVDLQNAVASAQFLTGSYQLAEQSYHRIPSAHWSSSEIGLNFALTLNELGKKDDALKVFNLISAPDTPSLGITTPWLKEN
jgi:tetratricopeptide (TPR) repeat protein